MVVNQEIERDLFSVKVESKHFRWVLNKCFHFQRRLEKSVVLLEVHTYKDQNPFTSWDKAPLALPSEAHHVLEDYSADFNHLMCAGESILLEYWKEFQVKEIQN